MVSENDNERIIRRRRPTRACLVAFASLGIFIASAFFVIIIEIPGTGNSYEYPLQVWIGHGAIVIEPGTTWHGLPERLIKIRGPDSIRPSLPVVSHSLLLPYEFWNVIRYGGTMRRMQNTVGVSVLLSYPLAYLFIRLKWRGFFVQKEPGA